MKNLIQIRDYRPADRERVDSLVRAAWQELAIVMPGWSALEGRLGALTEKAAESEVIVAELEGELVGAAGYVGAHRPKPDFFDPAWPIVRLMSVSPAQRGKGIGYRLLEECMVRARRDGASQLALHTTPLMAAGQQLYIRSGFAQVRQLPDMYGVPYILMTKNL